MLNLHKLAQNMLNLVHPAQNILYFQAQGQINQQGLIQTQFLEPIQLKAQIQIANTSLLQQENAINQCQCQAKFYIETKNLTSPSQSQKLSPSPKLSPALSRNQAKAGDIIHILPEAQNNNQLAKWLVTGIVEDFSNSGWLCLTATLQIAEE